VDAADLYAALADRNRRRILEQVRQKERSVSELVRALRMRQPLVSHHLKVLREAGVIEPERRGTWIFYRLAPSAVERLKAFTAGLSGAPLPPDEAAVGYLADLILHNGKDQFGEFLPLFFRNFGDDKLPLVVYADVPFVAVLGRTEFAVRFMVALAGSLTIVTTYLLGKELFRRELPSFLAAASLAIMPWHIHYSRTGFGETVIFLLLLSFGLYLLLKAIRLETSLLPAAFTFAFSLYSYRAAWVVLPPLFLVIGVLYWRELLRDRRNLMWSLGVLAAFAVPILRHILSDSSDRSEQTWIFKVESDKSTLSLFWQYYRSYFSTSFLFTEGDHGPIVRHYLPGQGMIYWFQAPLLLLGFFGCGYNLNRRSLLVVALLLFSPLGGALSVESPHSLRAFAMALLGGLCAIAAFGCWGAAVVLMLLSQAAG